MEAAFSPQYANIPWVGASHLSLCRPPCAISEVSMLVNWGAVIGLFTTLVTGLYSQACGVHTVQYRSSNTPS